MEKSADKILRVVIVVDGRPGHEKQSFGIVNGLSKWFHVEKCVVDISKRTFSEQFRDYLGIFIPRVIPESIFPQKADLAIGTGTRTHSIILAAKKKFRIPAVTCMLPGGHLRNLFDVCFVPDHDGCKPKDNVVFTSGAPNALKDHGQHRGDRGLILLGGVDEKSHIWDERDIGTKIESIVSKDRHVFWTVSSSPRTPDSTVASMRELAAGKDNVEFFDYKDTGKGWVEQQYECSSKVWVTTDSISMLYEALSAGCLVHTLPVKWINANGKFKRNEEQLVDKGLVIPYISWERGEYQLSDQPQLNEAQRCAEYIVKKWWPENIR